MTSKERAIWRGLQCHDAGPPCHNTGPSLDHCVTTLDHHVTTWDHLVTILGHHGPLCHNTRSPCHNMVGPPCHNTGPSWTTVSQHSITMSQHGTTLSQYWATMDHCVTTLGHHVTTWDHHVTVLCCNSGPLCPNGGQCWNCIVTTLDHHTTMLALHCHNTGPPVSQVDHCVPVVDHCHNSEPLCPSGGPLYHSPTRKAQQGLLTRKAQLGEKKWYKKTSWDLHLHTTRIIYTARAKWVSKKVYTYGLEQNQKHALLNHLFSSFYFFFLKVTLKDLMVSIIGMLIPKYCRRFQIRQSNQSTEIHQEFHWKCYVS